METQNTESRPVEAVLIPQATPEQIAKVNDFIRKNIFTYNSRKISKDDFDGLHRDIETKLVLSHNISGKPSTQQTEIIDLASKYNTFEEGDNPHGERDFGAFDFKDTKYFFKFDYYDDTYEWGEVNGNRVLTIMQASEY